MGEPLDAALKKRIRAVLDRERVTEVELRRLAEEGRACALILSAQVEGDERRLRRLSDDATSSLSEMAQTLQELSELRPGLVELERLLAELDNRAHELRAAWIAAP